MSRIDEKLAEELKDRLKDRFTAPRDVDRPLRLATGVRLFAEYGTKFTPLNELIETLVDAMGDEGTLTLFLQQVYKSSPNLPDLREWLKSKFPGVDASPEDAPEFEFQQRGKTIKPATGLAGGLQRYVRPELGNVDILPWLMKGLDVARRVCRVEVNRNALGTGFLIGQDLVLTNWHVVQDYVSSNNTDDLSCRFDFAVAATGGTQDGDEVDVKSSGILASSPPAAAEMPGRPGLPQLGPDTLDFALLRLDGAPGAQRGWFDLSADAPELALDTPLLIVQHPNAAPLKLALDTNAVLKPIPPELRLRYATNTDHGSSGSPVLTMDWQLVALHHLGDPAPDKPEYNEGIPIGLIRDKLRAQGLGALIAKP